MEFPKELLSVLLFCVPGIVANYFRFSLCSLPQKRDEWQARLQFVLFSLASWGAIYYIALVGNYIFNAIYHTDVQMQSGVIHSVIDIFGQWTWPFILLVNIVLGIVVAMCDNRKIHERIFNPMRESLGQKAETRDDVWNRVLSRRRIFVKITLPGDCVLWGQAIHASSRDEKKVLYLADTSSKLDDRLTVCLPKSDGIYLDLPKGYSIEIYDGDKFAKNLEEKWGKPASPPAVATARKHTGGWVGILKARFLPLRKRNKDTDITG